jgi:group I intron endonuclease
MSEKAGIYCLRNSKNGKKYIGSSKHMRSRIIEHISKLEENIHSNRELQEAFNEDGLEFCVLEFIDDSNNKDLILKTEQKWINYYDSTNPEKGYNKINSFETTVTKSRKPWKRVEKPNKEIKIVDELARMNKHSNSIWKIIKLIFDL